MDKPSTKRLIRGLGANLYGQVVVAFIQLAGVPILLRYWHTQLYGEWLIVFAIPFYLSITDVGFSQSVANDMTARVARGDRFGALQVFQSLVALVLPVAVCGILVVAVVAFLLPIGHWFHFASLSIGQVRWVFWMLAAEVLVKLADGISHAGFRANGDYALHITIYYSTILAQHATVWTLAALGFGPVAAAAGFLSIRGAVTPAVAFLLTRRHPWLHFGFMHATLSYLRPLIRPAMANVGLPFAQALSVQGMVLLIASVLGPIAVVTFSTLRTLSRFVLQLVSVISQAAEPELAAAFGTGNRLLLTSLYEHAVRASLWFALLASVLLALGGEWILQLWTHGRVTMQSSLFYWLLASANASALWYSSLILLKAANRHLAAAIIYAGASAAALVLARVLLGVRHELASAGMSLLLIDVLMITYTMRAAGNLCESSPARSLIAACNPFPLLRLVSYKRYAT